MARAKLRADEQEHHMRRRLEASWHNTTKLCDLTATVNDAAVQGKFMLLNETLMPPLRAQPDIVPFSDYVIQRDFNFGA